MNNTFKKEVINNIIKEIIDTANDIDNYLASDVPLECYQKDIGIKLSDMLEKVKNMIDFN